MKIRFFAPFLDSETDLDIKAYDNFISSYLLYQRLFEYSGPIDSVLEMPYSLFNDMIKKQHEYKLKESEEIQESLGRNSNSKSKNTRFKRKK